MADVKEPAYKYADPHVNVRLEDIPDLVRNALIQEALHPVVEDWRTGIKANCIDVQECIDKGMSPAEMICEAEHLRLMYGSVMFKVPPAVVKIMEEDNG